MAHGIGQQVPFETLESVAHSVAQSAAETGDRPRVHVRMVKVEETQVPRAELTLRGVSGQNHEVHFYEIYWSPLTEGKVSLFDAISFLLQAAFDGMRRGLAGKFERWMFGGWPSFSRRTIVTVFQFLVGFFGVFAIVSMNATIVAVAGARLAVGGESRWSGDPLVSDLTVCLAFVDVLALLLFAWIFWIPRLIGPTPQRKGARRSAIRTARSFSRALVFVTMIFLMGFAILAPWITGTHLLELPGPFWKGALGHWAQIAVKAGQDNPAASRAVTLALWLVAIAASLRVRWFFIQYVGDLAAYISSHTTNKFFSTRQEIRKCATKVAAPVYRGKAGDGKPEYDRIILAGHSLGSVIAYDTLNGLLLEDEETGRPDRIRDRTPMLLTFGSPLDKTAFIFRNQRPRAVEIREALAAAVQPMITDYRFRPNLWVNVWSPDDWISGSLEYYDDVRMTSERAKWVLNIEDPDAFLPLAAHMQYFENHLVGKVLRLAVVNPDEVRALANPNG
jgi:hypothetical protein